MMVETTFEAGGGRWAVVRWWEVMEESGVKAPGMVRSKGRKGWTAKAMTTKVWASPSGRVYVMDCQYPDLKNMIEDAVQERMGELREEIGVEEAHRKGRAPPAPSDPAREIAKLRREVERLRGQIKTLKGELKAANEREAKLTERNKELRAKVKSMENEWVKEEILKELKAKGRWRGC